MPSDAAVIYSQCSKPMKYPYQMPLGADSQVRPFELKFILKVWRVRSDKVVLHEGLLHGKVMGVRLSLERRFVRKCYSN